MTASSDMTKTVHQGRNIKRFREMLGIKQERLAIEMGEDWSQKRISVREQKDVIEQDILDQVAKILNIPAEAIKNFNEEAAISYINTFNDQSTNQVIGNYGVFNFNPVDKWVEALEENKKLYERLLQSEKEKVELLQQLLNKKK